jgi:multidrug efflux pump subunit AcrA (membrane-fusion protein)
VQSITPKGDPVTKTYRVRLSLPADTPLRIGMSADVNIVIRVSREALLLPSLAVRNDGVFVLEGEIARRRPVETGIRGTANVEILSGIDLSAKVVSPYPENLEDGASARALEDGATAQAEGG